MHAGAALTLRQCRRPGGFVPRGEGGAPASREGARRVSRPLEALFNSPEAERIKAEIVATGKKLWHRQYVDGNGGNISYRIGPNEVICTPTLCSKYDLTPELICLVDLEGNQLAGSAARTSEIFLHLEIYKAVPEAKGVVHCHPPHATAYAITGRVPPSGIVPEFDVFVGAVALTPYETPGTKRFAETVLPFVQNYNTVLLGNHGIVCWADTVTHAEWYAEVLETYCWTLTIAAGSSACRSAGSRRRRPRTCSASRSGWACRTRGSPRTSARSPSEDPDAPSDGITLMPPRPCACALRAAPRAGRRPAAPADVERTSSCAT